MPEGRTRIFRTMALSVAAVAVGLLLLLALPPVQLMLAKAVASRSDAVELDVGGVWAGPWGVEVEGLELELPRSRLRISADRVDINLAFWRSLFGLALDVEAAELRELDVEAELSGQGTFARTLREWLATERAPVLRLPNWIALRALDADGDFSIVTARGTEVAGPWELTARSVAPDAIGSLQAAADVGVGRQGDTLAALSVGVDGRATIDAQSLIRDVDITANVDPSAPAEPGEPAEPGGPGEPGGSGESGGPGEPGGSGEPGGPSGPAGVEARITAELRENIAVAASILGGAGNTLAELAANISRGRALELGWELNLTPGAVAAFARGRSVADLSGRSTGQVSADLTSASIAAASSTRLRGTGWDVYDPRLEGLGTLTLAAELEGRHEPGVLDADRLEIAIGSDERGELLRIRAEQPLRYELGEWLVDPETWGEPALSIRVSALPLAWLGALTPAIELESGELNGAVEFVRSEERRTELRVLEPIHASGVQLAPIGGNEIPAFEVSVSPHATLANGALEAEIDALDLKAVTGLEVTFDGRATTSRTAWPRAGVEGNLTARVPMLRTVAPQLDSVNATLNAELNFDSLVLAITQVTFGADAFDGTEMLAAELAGETPLQLRLPMLAADWSGFEPRTASLDLDGLPIDWISAFVPELEFRGGRLFGRLTASGAIGRGLTLEAQEPLRVAGFVPVYRGMEADSAWTATFRPRVHLQTSASSIMLDDLTVETVRGNALRADVSVEGAGENRIATTFALEADVGELASRAGLRIGLLHARLRATLEPAEMRYAVEELSIDIEDPTGTDVISLESLQPFDVSVSPFAVSAANAPANVIRATISPLRLERLLPSVVNLDLEGSLPEGEFFGRAEPNGALVLVAREPLVFRDVSVRWGDAVLLDRVTSSVQYEVSYSGDGLQARSVELTATGGDGRTLLRTSSRVSAPLTSPRLLNRGAIEFEAYLAPLSQQPLLDDMPSFASGVLSGSLAFVDEDATSLTTSLRLNDAVADVIGTLPDVDLALDAAGVRGERVAVTMPLRLASEEFGPSSLRLAGGMTMDAERVAELDATLSGERLAVEDLQRLASVVLSTARLDAGEDSNGEEPVGEEPAAEETAALAPLSQETLSAIAKLRAERHTIPIWTDSMLARARVTLDELAFAGFSIGDVRGALEVTHEAATLTDVHASLFGADLVAGARVDFDAERAEPYTLDFRAEIEDLSLEAVFQSAAPGAAPVAEGRFDLSSTLTSAGLNPLDVGLSSQGRLHLTGGEGIFRGLAAHAGTGAVASRVVGILTFSRELRAIGRLLDGLGEIRFDEAEFLLERSRPDRIEVSSLYVRSPQLELDATGSLELARLRPLVVSPLDVDLRIAARDDVAILFDGMGLLEEEADADGYRPFETQVHVGGTPVEPDTSDFWQLLETAANESRGVLGVGLRALDRRLEARTE